MGKVLISLDDELVHRIDAEARAHGLSRSAYLARLAQRELGLVSAAALRRRRRGLAMLDELFAATPSGESTTEIRAGRDER